ncbi:hypothetical protein FRUB_00537 [Fimbriiglobus ruber]|uniref:Uncharacterized protein n=1 Tax=Fimbriiglobus ruber TaxID=1908690 RepID=A0A225E7V0_9BACT|nr:hypothetical protein FRUB_00537 [Fimbriiglobus ruber]
MFISRDGYSLRPTDPRRQGRGRCASGGGDGKDLFTSEIVRPVRGCPARAFAEIQARGLANRSNFGHARDAIVPRDAAAIMGESGGNRVQNTTRKSRTRVDAAGRNSLAATHAGSRW